MFPSMVIKFYLTNAQKESKLRIAILIGRSYQLKIASKFTIEPKHWDSKNQRAKKTMIGYEVLNQSLDELKMNVLKYIRELQLIEKLDWNQLTLHLRSYLQPEKLKRSHILELKPNEQALVSVINVFLVARTVEYKPETTRKYKVLEVVLLDFQEVRKKPILVQDVSFALLEEFRLYLLNERNNRNDTIYKMLASLKCLIRWMLNNGYQVDPKSLEVRQKVKVKHDIVTLTEQELQRLEDVKLNAFHSPIRDCFLFQVYTAQRFSDMQQLSPDQINGDTWKFRSIKNGKDMYVPLVGWCRKAKDIGEKFGFCFPKYTQQYFNRELTKICRLAGIIEQVILTRYQGSSLLQMQKPKCDWVSSHTARRTSVSLLLAKGVPPTVVMKLTGHSSIQTMMRYERTTNEVLVNSLLAFS
jgi:integrase